jgi:hypothetical protein
VRDNTHPELTLFVRVPHTTAAQDDALLRELRAQIDAGGHRRHAGRVFVVEHGCEQLDRYIDDYLYHTRVRPQINAELQSQGVGEHYWLAPDAARRAGARVRAAHGGDSH